MKSNNEKQRVYYIAIYPSLPYKKFNLLKRSAVHKSKLSLSTICSALSRPGPALPPWFCLLRNSGTCRCEIILLYWTASLNSTDHCSRSDELFGLSSYMPRQPLDSGNPNFIVHLLIPKTDIFDAALEAQQADHFGSFWSYQSGLKCPWRYQ